MRLVKDKQFYKSIAVLALPVIFQNMITIGVNIMDTVMVGKLGQAPLSATSLATNYVDIFFIFTLGLGGGATVLISQYWGKGDKTTVKKVVNIMFRFCMVVAALFTAVAVTMPSRIMRMYSPDPEVIRLGVVYLRWSIPTYIVHGIVMMMSISLRAIRKVKVPFLSSIVSFFVNIFFNWMFIFGNLGAPRLEVAGAALGTILARFSEFLFIGIYYFFMDKDLQFRLRDLFKPCGELFPTFLKYGIPVIVSDMLLTFGNSAISIIIGHTSTSFVAANAMIVPVMRLCNVATMGLAMAMSIVIGHTIGRGDVEGARDQGITGFFLSIVTGVVAALLVIVICPLVFGMYDMPEQTIAIADELVYAVSLVLVFQSIQSVLTKGVLRGGGDTRFVMVADVLFMWIFSIPLGAVCALVWHLSPFIIYVTLKSDMIIKTVWCTTRLFKRQWIKKVYEN